MNIAICDDEKASRETVEEYLQPFIKAGNNLSIAQFASGEALLAQLEKGAAFHLIFLDVEMAKLSGVETAKRIREIDQNVLFIFITAHQKYVPDAFVVGAFQFLTKPLQGDFFKREFERALQTYQKAIHHYIITCKEQTVILTVRDILYIETYDRHLRACTQENKYEFAGNIGIEENILLEYNFVRCHKGYLVNMRHISAISKNDFVLSNGTIIPISKHKKNEVLNRFNRFVAGGL
jgi:DNA-binding LytR/AlgR family response regulator